jgi:hypothetical protein
MSAFLTELQVELVSDSTNEGRGTWRLTAPLVYQSDVAGRVFVVPEGFETDFASVPRIPVAFLLTADSAHEASVVHDYAYSTHIVDRETADAVLREASAVTGIPWLRRQATWLGVRCFGGSHW